MGALTQGRRSRRCLDRSSPGFHSFTRTIISKDSPDVSIPAFLCSPVHPSFCSRRRPVDRSGGVRSSHRRHAHLFRWLGQHLPPRWHLRLHPCRRSPRGRHLPHQQRGLVQVNDATHGSNYTFVVSERGGQYFFTYRTGRGAETPTASNDAAAGRGALSARQAPACGKSTQGELQSDGSVPVRRACAALLVRLDGACAGRNALVPLWACGPAGHRVDGAYLPASRPGGDGQFLLLRQPGMHAGPAARVAGGVRRRPARCRRRWGVQVAVDNLGQTPFRMQRADRDGVFPYRRAL